MVFDLRSTLRDNHDLRRVVLATRLAKYPRETVPSRKIQIFDVYRCFLSSFAVMTCVGCLDTRTASTSPEFTSFLLRMCIDKLESMTNVLSSGLITEWRRKTPKPPWPEERGPVLLQLSEDMCALLLPGPMPLGEPRRSFADVSS